MRIGVLGGTFDPPHAGHLALARAAQKALGLEEVIFLPAFRNPLKKERMVPAKDRLEMVRRAISGESGFAVADIEVRRGGPSYAYDTMQELNHVQPAEYWFILGADALKDFEQWKQPEKLLKLTRLGVVTRGHLARDQVLAGLPEYARPSIDWIDMPPVDISATELRQRISSGRAVSQWLKPEVERYILEKKLYRSS